MVAEMLRRPPVVYARPRLLQDRITTCDLHSFSGGKGWRGKVRIVVSGHSTCFHPLLLYTETSLPLPLRPQQACSHMALPRSHPPRPPAPVSRRRISPPLFFDSFRIPSFFRLKSRRKEIACGRETVTYCTVHNAEQRIILKCLFS